jgi:hypothetical protein
VGSIQITYLMIAWGSGFSSSNMFGDFYQKHFLVLFTNEKALKLQPLQLGYFI